MVFVHFDLRNINKNYEITIEYSIDFPYSLFEFCKMNN